MTRALALASLFLLSLSSAASAATSCIAFDIHWNLLAFNFGGKDFNAGLQSTWTQGDPADITTQGRPPFDGSSASCYLSQFANAIYVLGADSSNPAAVYLYDVDAHSWSTQAVNAGKFDPSDYSAILDHDTNIFYAYSKGEIFALDMELLKAANATTKEWIEVQEVSWDTSNYRPTMALAQNHVHFLGVPDVPNGNAKIFVIHFSYMQPEPQAYGDFPNTHGQVSSFFKDSGVQTKFAFIPDTGSATYVIDVTTNTTETLKGPVTQDSRASYFASTSALVQLTSSGSLSYLSYDQEDTARNSATDWVAINKLDNITPATSPSSNGTTSEGSPVNSSNGATSGGSPVNSSNSNANNNSARKDSFMVGWLWSALALALGTSLL